MAVKKLLATGNSSVTAVPVTIGIEVAEDAYDGDAQFTVAVDGTLVGGVQTATVLASSGTYGIVQVPATLTPGVHTVTVTFTNDLYGGMPSTDRNLYVRSIDAGGPPVELYASLLSTGNTATATLNVPAVAPTVIGSGLDTLTFQMSEDAYKGDAAFTIAVDGVQVGGVQTATASHAAGAEQEFDVHGNFAAGEHTIAVTFLNDLYAGTPSTDRNLYVDSVQADGVAVTAAARSLYSSGTQTIDFAMTNPGMPPTITAGSGSDLLALAVTEDSYLGDAQFTVAIDGVQVGGVMTATANQGSPSPQEFYLHGNFAPGPHKVTVDFLNDLYGGSSTTDRNLYVNSATLDGRAVPTAAVALYSAGARSFTFQAPTAVTAAAHVSLLGVNLSGGEYGNAATGVINVNYQYPTDAEIDYYASEGLNVIRIPFLMERIQPVQDGPLNLTELANLDQLVSYAAAKGIQVDLDAHNYGYAFGNEIGSAGTPNSSFANFWGQIAAHYAAAPNVMFGLMDEPHDQTPAQWAASAQAAVTAIRSTGAGQEILVSGTDYDNASSWVSSGNAITVGAVTDPGHNMAFEVHQYFDPDGSGSSAAVVSPTVGPDRLAAATDWALATGNRLFLGEFGAAQDPASLTALGNTLNFLNANARVWQGGTYFAGGPRLGNYMFSAEPQNGVTAPQTALLSAAIHQ